MIRLGATLLPALLACVTLASCTHFPLPAGTEAPGASATAARPAASAPGGRAASAPRGAASGQAAATPPRGAASAPEAGQPPLRPFQAVVQGATREDGFIPIWRKDDKVWFEIAPARWNQPFFFTINLTHGIGEGNLFGNQMGTPGAGRPRHVASLRRFGPQGVQLVARNVAYLGTPEGPARVMAERAFSDSLLGQAAVASQPHPTSQAVLVEANALVVNDFPMGAAYLERQYRQGYAFDARNSGIERVRQSESETGLQVRAHYGLGRVATPTPGSPAPAPSLPATVPDARSLFLGYYWSFSRLPEPMRPRPADPRVGYFATQVADFSDPNRRLPMQRHIARWRLEKKDPQAALSEPKQPIVYWLDRNIPLAYREVVKAGILEWNKAFERIGFKDAIVVRQQGDDDEIDTSATRFASIRWVAGNGVPFAGRGPSKTDPRTGEILDADIEINEAVTRIYASRVAEDPPRPSGLGLVRSGGEDCDYADAKLSEAAFALDVLAARGDLAWGSPAAERWVMDALKDLLIHEVGHTLGLRHNFRGSMAVPEEKLASASWGAENGISASVMDYNAVNIAPAGEPQGQYWMTTIGPYDYWAIEYGYRPFEPKDEAAGLNAILARSNEPGLAYATDEDAGATGWIEGVDPEVSRRDLSSNPLGFYRKRFAVVQELWQRLQSRELPAGTPYDQLRRNFDRSFRMMAEVSELTAKYVGGLTVRRDVIGGGRAQPVAPVDAQRQKLALDLLTRHLFEVDAFRFKPEFLGRMLPDMDERANEPDSPSNKLDYSVAQRVFGIQRSALNQLLRDTVAARLIDAREQSVGGDVLTLPQLYGTLQQAIWRDLAGQGAIPLMRRNLQREHIRLLAEALARPSPRMPADARSLQREFAQRLLRELRAASAARGNGDALLETRAHLNESIALLEAALKAQVSRAIG